MKPGMAWPMGVAVILGATIAANLWVMRVANADPAFAIEPDYYKKAVNYDSTMAQARANLSLGWAVITQFAPVRDRGQTPISVALHDSAAAPITGAHVTIMARFNARANDTLTAVLTEARPGEYSAALPITHAGEWEVRVDATRAGARFSASTRVTAVRAVAATTLPPSGELP